MDARYGNVVLGLDALEEKYEVLERIGGGGMGTVHKVRHRLLDEMRVVKVMSPHLVGSEEYRERFAREARTAIKLRHPNTATLYDFSVAEDGTAYMIFEFIDGVNLSELLRLNAGPPPLGLLLEIACQSLAAVGYLHRRGLVHRDIAPDNLMVTLDDDGQPLIKLIDLGIVKAIETSVKLTRSGLYLGKIHYSAPEQLGGGDPGELESRSDLYSFGAVLYEMATGSCPVEGENPAAIMSAHLFHGPLPFDRTDPEGKVHPTLKAIILKAMARKPEDRFASAEEFIAALDLLRAEHPVEQEVLAAILDARYRGRRPSRGQIAAERPTRQEAAMVGAEGAAAIAAPPIAVLDTGPFVEQIDDETDDLSDKIEQEVEAAVSTIEEIGTPTERVAEALLEGAHKLLDLGHLDEARSQLEVLLRLEPGNKEARQLFKEIDRGSSTQEAEALAALVTSITAHLDRGDSTTAATLLDSVEGMIGHSRVLQRLRARIEQEQREHQHLSSMIDELMTSSAQLSSEPDPGPAIKRPARRASASQRGRGGVGPARVVIRPESERRERETAAATASVEEFLRQGNLEEAARALQLASRLCGDRDIFRSLQARIDEGLAERKKRSTKVGRLVRNAKKSSTAGDYETALSFLEEAAQLDPSNPEVARQREEAERIFVRVSKERRAEIETWPGLQPLDQLLNE